MDYLKQKACQLPRPQNYFQGLDWQAELLPREILSFCRTSQDHRTNGWEGISAKAGRYDQHARYVLLIVLEGKGSVGAETSVWAVKEGDALILKPYQIHYYLDLPEEFCWLYITFELDEDLKGGVRQMPEGMKESLEEFLTLYQGEKALDASVALGSVLKELEGMEPRPSVEPAHDDNLIGRVKEYVMGHLEHDLSIPALARSVDVSESYLRATFREGAGISLGHFVRSVRLVRATYLIQNEDLELGEVALRSGFKSLTSFTRAFRRMYDMTPSEYRRKKSS